MSFVKQMFGRFGGNRRIAQLDCVGRGPHGGSAGGKVR